MSEVSVSLKLLHNNSKMFYKSMQCRGTIYSYFDFGLKPAVVSCLTNALAPLLIALERCSRAETDRTVF